VQFFHRTVRDFVLETSKQDDTARKFQNLTDLETYYRLWLAELLLEDLPGRVEAWNDAICWDLSYNFRFGRKGPPGELPSDLPEGFSHVVEDEDLISKPTDDGDSENGFQGISCTSPVWYPNGKVSFVCLAACVGQQKFVLQKIAKTPELLTGNGECHVLLSAALNCRMDTVRALLQKGASPMDCVSSKVSFNYGDKLLAEGLEYADIPIWMIFTVYLVARRFISGFVDQAKYDILELLLQDKRVDASNCWFLLSDGPENKETHFITLKQSIQDDKPGNMDQLLVLLQRRNRSLVNSATHFFAKYTPFLKQTESVLDEETSGYTQFRLPKAQRPKMNFSIAICGDLRVDGRVMIKVF
jgi:hypothetical protein